MSNKAKANSKLVEILFQTLESIDEYEAGGGEAFLDAEGISFTRCVIRALQARLSSVGEPNQPTDDGVREATALTNADLSAPALPTDLLRVRKEWELAYGRLWGEYQRHTLHAKRFNQFANVCTREAAAHLAAFQAGDKTAGESLLTALRRGTDDARARAETLECVRTK